MRYLRSAALQPSHQHHLMRQYPHQLKSTTLPPTPIRFIAGNIPMQMGYLSKSKYLVRTIVHHLFSPPILLLASLRCSNVPHLLCCCQNKLLPPATKHQQYIVFSLFVTPRALKQSAQPTYYSSASSPYTVPPRSPAPHPSPSTPNA